MLKTQANVASATTDVNFLQTKQQLIDTLTRAGYQLERDLPDLLPYHHVMEFRFVRARRAGAVGRLTAVGVAGAVAAVPVLILLVPRWRRRRRRSRAAPS